MTEIEIKDLIKKAYEASAFSYSPYSELCIGAALLTEEGEVYTGTNIENATYGATVCAERTAVFKAVSEGKKNFKSIAVVCRKEGILPYPCGICRQVLAEFNPKMDVIVATNFEEYKIVNLSELLTYPFEFIKNK